MDPIIYTMFVMVMPKRVCLGHYRDARDQRGKSMRDGIHPTRLKNSFFRNFAWPCPLIGPTPTRLANYSTICKRPSHAWMMLMCKNSTTETKDGINGFQASYPSAQPGYAVASKCTPSSFLQNTHSYTSPTHLFLSNISPSINDVDQLAMIQPLFNFRNP